MTELAGCYELRTSDYEYVVRLLTTRSTSEWDARLDEPRAPGGWWSWVPIDSTHLKILWVGIDGTLTYAIERQGERLGGEETFASSNTKTETTRPVRVQRVSCAAATG